jgi:hypothetical protein
MSGMAADRLAAIRAAVARIAREKRWRDTRPADFGRYAGRYRGPHRDFLLEWVEDECGYRRHVEQTGPWRWEDPTVLSTAEVRQRVEAREWRPT